MILGKLLYKLGLPFCEHCGKHKSFDDEKFNLGYKVKSMCPDCDRPTGMMRGYLFWDKPMRNEDEYIPRSVDTMTEDERKLYLESMGF